MDVLWDKQRVLEATKGECYAEAWQATSVEIDSRAVTKGSLFIAIMGEYNDGHHYVKQALENGAAAAIVQYIPEDVSADAPLVIVEDTFEALRNLGIYKREYTQAKVIGITGSVGKTSTKEITILACEALGKTHATIGNLNNHYGVPLTLARTPDDAEYAIYEMGMNHAGEISDLTSMVRPHIAVITAVEIAHIEFFDSIYGIADAKCEIFDGIEPNGTAIINRDNRLYDYQERKVQESEATHMLSFGQHAQADSALTEYRLDNAGKSHLTITIEEKAYHITLAVPGIHQACNIACVCAILHACEADIEKAITGIEQFALTAGRGAWKVIGNNPQEHYTIIDDCYNASPASMAAALDVMKDVSARKIVILADMLELGEESPEYHQALADNVIDAGIDHVYTVGEQMQYLFNALPGAIQGKHFDSSEACNQEIANYIKPGDVVLIKGSNGMHLKPVVATLSKQEHAA